MKKRLLAAIMSLCMIVSLLPVSALAVEDEDTAPAVEEMVPLEPADTEAEPQNAPEQDGEYDRAFGLYDVYLDFANNIPVSRGTDVTVSVGGEQKEGTVTQQKNIWGDYYGPLYVLVNDLVSGYNPGQLTATVTSNDGYSGTAIVQWDGGWFGDDRYEGTVSNWSKPGEPSHSDTDAYFYVLKPDYKGSAGTTEPRFFYYVGKGSVTDGSAEVDVANGVDNRITTEPTASVDAFNRLGLDGTEVLDYVGTNFENVTWYRVKKADGANGNNGSTIVGADKSCWHVDGMVNPQPPYYAVVFMMDDSVVYQYMIDANESITEAQINHVTNMVNNDQSKPTGTHVEWYFKSDYSEPAPNNEIIAKSNAMEEGETLYIYGQYKEDFVENKSVAVEKTVKLNGVPVTAGTEAEAGDTLTYTIKITNTGNVELTDVQIKDTFTGAKAPDNESPAPSAGWSPDGTGNQTATWTIGNLAVKGEATITYTYTVDKDDAGSTIKNTAAAVGVSEEDDTNNDTEVTVKEPEKYTITVNYVDDSTPTQTIKESVTLDGQYTSGDHTFTVGEDENFLEAITTDGGDKYIYAASDKTVSVTVSGENAEITLVYTKDNWNATTGDETGGDGIADKYQALVKFESADTSTGTVSGTGITQVFTFGNETGGYQETGTVDPDMTNVTTSAITGYAFDIWTENDGTTAVNPDTLKENVQGGTTITFKAHFEVDALKDADKTPEEDTDSTTGSDGIPDKYQATVTYTVEGGTWYENGPSTVTQVYTTAEKVDGAWTDQTVYLANIPAVTEVVPDSSHVKDGNWDGDTPTTSTAVVGGSKYAFKYKLNATVPALSVTKTADKTSVAVGDSITYEVTIENSGTGTLNNVIVKDTMWVEGKVTSVQVNGTETDLTKSDTGDTYFYKIESLSEDAKVVITYTYQTKDADIGKLENKVTVTANEVPGGETDTPDTPVDVKNVFDVTFNSDGGTAVEPQRVVDGEKAIRPADPTKDGYTFAGWYLGDTAYDFDTPVTGNITLVAHWTDTKTYTVTIAPADITVYTGGEAYGAIVGENGEIVSASTSGLPEPGYHITLSQTVMDWLNLEIGEPGARDLADYLTFRYEDDVNNREWKLTYLGVYSTEPMRYVYSMSPVNPENSDVRLEYIDGNDVHRFDDEIEMGPNAASAEYTMSIYGGEIEQKDIQAVLTANGNTLIADVVIETGTLTIRSTVDDDTTPIAGNEDEVSGGSFTAVHTGASYKVNDSEVDVPTTGDRVHLLVDQVSNSTAFNNAMGEAALDHPQVNGTAFETVYLDLVDTQNGNTVVTLDSGSMDIYWPMPSNADPYGDFQVVHYVDMNREVSTTEDQLDNQRTELLDGTAERINGDWYVRFTTHSFSPFVLVYEEDTSRPVNPNPGGGSGGGDDHDPTGNLSIELDVNGGDDEFTFTVILTDKDGDDLENNFYYNGDYTGTIGSGDEITLEGGDKIVIRNLPEGTRYEVIIETADGYTYVIDGEEGVIHTGMNEAEFTATRTVPVADPSVTGVSRWLNTTDHIAYLTGYPGGAFGPDNNMTRAEVAQMFYALLNNKNVTITKTFPDVPADAWYAAAVNTLASLGMVSGDENGNYRPNDPITRAEFCVIALAFAYEPENAVCYFGDVSRSDWFYTYVAQAASYGWIGGYTNGNFGPNDRITRAQVTTIVNNMLGRAADRDYVIDHQADLVQFSDLTRAHWGYFQIMEATNAHDYTKSNGTENWR